MTTGVKVETERWVGVPFQSPRPLPRPIPPPRDGFSKAWKFPRPRPKPRDGEETIDGELVMLPSKKVGTSGTFGLKKVGGDPKLERGGGGALKDPTLRLTRRSTFAFVASEGSESARRGDRCVSLVGELCFPFLEVGIGSVGSKRLFLLGTPLPRVETLLRDFPEVPVEIDQEEGLLGSSMKRLKEASQAAEKE